MISKRTDRYYVIIASFQSESDARREADKYKEMEGAQLKILKNTQGQFRISIKDYSNLEEAKTGKEKYKEMFTGAWILNF